MNLGRPVGSFFILNDTDALHPDEIMSPYNALDLHGSAGLYHTASNGSPIDRIASFTIGDLILEQVIKELRTRTPADYALNLKFYDGDHWQNGQGWSGAMPPAGSPDHLETKKQVKKTFRSRNVIKQVTRRHARAVIGHEPGWAFVPENLADVRRLRGRGQVVLPAGEPSPTQAYANTLNSALTRWWDTHAARLSLYDGLTKVLLGRRGPLRLLISPNVVDERGQLRVSPTSLDEALSYIYVHSPALDECTILTSQETMQDVGVYAFKRKDGSMYGEITYVLGRGDDARTFLNTLDVPASDRYNRRQSRSAVRSQSVMQLGDLLTMYEMTGEQLITQQVREQQMAINENGTMARVNGQLAGFLERVILNGQLPGHYEGEGPERKFVRDDYETGAGSVNVIMGVPIRDENGRIIGMTNPSMNYRNPVDPAYFKATEDMHYAALLAEVDQTDELLTGGEYASAESRKTSRAGFVDSLLDSRATVNAAGRWMIESVVRLALWLQGDQAIQQFEDAGLRPMFRARVNAGPATTETIRSGIELRTARALSREGLQEMAGVEDTDAENARIAAEEADGVPWPEGNVATGRVAGSLSNDRNKREKARSNGSRPDSDSASSRAAFGSPNQ